MSRLGREMTHQTEEQAAAELEGVRGESPVEDLRDGVGPSSPRPASEGLLPKSCQDSSECRQPAAQAATLEDGKETAEGGGPRSTVNT